MTENKYEVVVYENKKQKWTGLSKHATPQDALAWMRRVLSPVYLAGNHLAIFDENGYTYLFAEVEKLCTGMFIDPNTTTPAPATDAADTLSYEVVFRNWENTSDYLRKVEAKLDEETKRAERAESALADVGTQLEIADTRNTDMVLALERAEAALSELLARVDAVEKTAVNALENYDEYGYEQLAQAAVSAHVCKLIRGAKPGGEGGAV